MTVGEKIRYYRKLKNISAKQLGAIIGISENSIRNYEIGFRKVSDEKLKKIADGLSMPLEAFYERRLVSEHDSFWTIRELAESGAIEPVLLLDGQAVALVVKDLMVAKLIKEWVEEGAQYGGCKDG